MSDNTVFVKNYINDSTDFAINEKEIWRYAGFRGSEYTIEPQLDEIMHQVIKELSNSFTFKVCYRRMPLQWIENEPQLPFKTKSKDLATCLQNCTEVVLFAATIGFSVDRMIAKYQHISPTKALLIQAFGTERIETLCDVFCREFSEESEKEKLSCTTRFSPGYGDLPLETQVEFFHLLDCPRHIGVSLNESLLMSPSKSVTAIFGLGKSIKKSCVQNCLQCNQVDCEFRKK